MVRTAEALLSRLAEAVRADYDRLREHLKAAAAPNIHTPGLYTYRLDDESQRLRLHLRLHADGSGLLFINAVETLYLQPVHAETAKLVLDGLEHNRALALLCVRYPRTSTDELERQLRLVRASISAVKRPTQGCRTCSVSLPQPSPLSVRAHAPYKADLALHYACNNNCSYCYNEPGRRRMPSLPAAQWRQVIEKLYAIGVPYVIFTGGEPTLHPALVELVAHAEQIGQITGVNTNGRRLADRALTSALAGAGLDHVQVTLNSYRAGLHNAIVGADAFDETVTGIRTALECGLHTLTNTTLMVDNVDEAASMVDFLHSLGLRTFAMNGMIYSGCGARHPAALDESTLAPVLEGVRDRAGELGMRFLWYTPTRYCRLSPVELGLGVRTCNAAEYSICIEPNGNVLPCQSYYVPAGNLLADDWAAIWESALFRSFRHRREQPAACGLPEQCVGCAHLTTCGGGCPLERREHTQASQRSAGACGVPS